MNAADPQAQCTKRNPHSSGYKISCESTMVPVSPYMMVNALALNASVSDAPSAASTSKVLPKPMRAIVLGAQLTQRGKPEKAPFKVKKKTRTTNEVTPKPARHAETA